MKKLLIVAFLCFLAGCDKSPMDKAKQDFACRNNGGVYRYVYSINKAQCLDGTVVDRWYETTITPEYYPKVKEQD